MASAARSVGVSLQWKGAYKRDEGEISRLELCWESSKENLKAIAYINRQLSSSSKQSLIITKDEHPAYSSKLKLDPACVKTIQITAHFFETIKVRKEQADGRLKLEEESVLQTFIVPISKIPPLKEGNDLIITVIHEHDHLSSTFEAVEITPPLNFHEQVVKAEEELEIAYETMASAVESKDNDATFHASIRLAVVKEALQQLRNKPKPSNCIVC